MSKQRTVNPTRAEFEILEVIWERGPSTVREVLRVLTKKRERAYTTIMTLMAGMEEKGLLSKKQKGRAFIYTAKVNRDKTRSRMVKDLLGRAFGGSSKALMIQILEDTKADKEELKEIRKTIEEYEKKNS